MFNDDHDEDAFLSVEDRNYARDRRVRATYIAVPEAQYHWEVCDLCEGSGTVVNPSIDAGGLTREDFDDDEDFREDYRRGVYDIRCPQCRGRSTIPVEDNPAADSITLDGDEWRRFLDENRHAVLFSENGCITPADALLAAQGKDGLLIDDGEPLRIFVRAV